MASPPQGTNFRIFIVVGLCGYLLWSEGLTEALCRGFNVSSCFGTSLGESQSQIITQFRRQILRPENNLERLGEAIVTVSGFGLIPRALKAIQAKGLPQHSPGQARHERRPGLDPD